MGIKADRKRLTPSRLDALKPQATAYNVSDPDCRGLAIHVAPTGVKSWWWRFYWKGRRQILTVGRYPDTGVAVAHDTVSQARGFLERGIDPRDAGLTRQRAPASTPTPISDSPYSIEALVADFLERFIAPNRKHPDTVKRMLEKDVLSHWAGRDVRTIKPRDVIDLLDQIVKRGRRVMANRVAAILKQLFKYAIHRQVLDTTPVQLLYAPGGEEKSRNRALSDPELVALLASMDTVMSRAPRTVAAIRIILHTACRRSEIGLARWSHFDLNDKSPLWRVPVELSKTEIEYAIPLVPAAVAVLKDLKRAAGRSPWVFANGTGDGAADPKIFTRSLNRHLKLLAKKGIKPFTLHDLRRTVRTGMAKLKIEPHIAERVLNHAQPGIVAAYDVHAYLDEKREALEKWAAHLAGLKS